MSRILFTMRLWAVPSVLVIAACVHMSQWSRAQRSSWGTGAGFGMFATVDYHGSRFFRVYLDDGNQRVAVEIAPEINQGLGLKARAFPNVTNLDRLGAAIWAELDSKGQSLHDKPLVVSPDSSLLIEIWGMKIDTRRKRLIGFPIRNYVYLPPKSQQLDHATGS